MSLSNQPQRHAKPELLLGYVFNSPISVRTVFRKVIFICSSAAAMGRAAFER